LDRENNSRIEAQRWPEKQPGRTTVGVCAKGINKELNSLDEADFVRDVENRIITSYPTGARPR
jgi:hypothetical protein